jgi:hypothetical protein
MLYDADLDYIVKHEVYTPTTLITDEICKVFICIFLGLKGIGSVQELCLKLCIQRLQVLRGYAIILGGKIEPNT